jgi:cell division septation protein DedD
MKYRGFIAAAIAISLAGCFGNKQEVEKPVQEPVVETPAKAPFPEQQPAAVAPAPEPATQQAQTAAGAGMPDPSGSRGTVQQVWGWRVQIFVSGTIDNARKVAEEARWKFKDQQIYINESEPYYKVQVGNCLTRQDADNLKQRAKALGYDGAFVVLNDLTR